MRLRPSDVCIVALTEHEASILTLALRNLIELHDEQARDGDRTAATAERVLHRVLAGRAS